MSKRVLIIGAITDFGGREIEVKIISASLVGHYEVSLLSTVSMSSNSSAILAHSNFKWSTVDRIISKNIMVCILNNICKFRFSRKEPAYFFTKNKISHLFVDFEKRYLQILEKEVQKHQYICYVGDLNSKWLNETILFSQKHHKPMVFRITAAINEFKGSNLNYISKIFVSSRSNAQILEANLLSNVKIIDQSTMCEEVLLHMEIKPKSSKLVYGFLGRFSPEKGIVNLLEFFSHTNYKLILAGSGPLQGYVSAIVQATSNIQCLGELKNDEIHSFFSQIDVLIIPSVTEAGPLVGIEAMAAGKLIISTKVGAMEDRLSATKNKFWIETNDLDSLREVIQRVDDLSAEDYDEIRRSVRSAYIQNYSLEELKKQYLDLLEEDNC